MRNYRHRAYMGGLTAKWIEPLAADYRGLGHKVETGEDWIRVHGITQADLCRRLNDPLGEPGHQLTRHPLHDRHQRKHKPMSEEDYLLGEEEARYTRPDYD